MRYIIIFNDGMIYAQQRIHTVYVFLLGIGIIRRIIDTKDSAYCDAPEYEWKTIPTYQDSETGVVTKKYEE
jgi:hypothetical protein